MPKKKSTLFHLPITIAKFDIWIFAVSIFLTLFGLIMIYNASVVIAERDFADKYHYARDQATWVVVGFVIMLIFSFIDYHVWRRLALPILVTTLVLLMMVFVPVVGIKALGASRWINFGFFIVQPAELAKPALVVYLASWLSNKERRRFFAFVLLIGLVVGLIMLEPDMGTAVVLGSTAMIIYFLSGAPLWHFFLLIPAGAAISFILIRIVPYRLERFLTFLDPLRDPLGASYHIHQTLLALGSGGLLGVGLGKSLQKYAYLPESTTDSIFAIVAEEIGFVGSVFIIMLFFFLIFRAFMVAKKAPDTFGILLCSGIASFLAIQVIINLSAQVALLPFTGVPLPFISYGGSSLLVTLAAIGIVLNISKHIA